MKTCTKCGVSKTSANFGNAAKGMDGKRAQCKECEAAYQSTYKALHPDRVRAIKERWRVSNLSKRAELQHEWAKKNPDKAEGYTRAWRAANKEQVRRTMAVYRAVNKQKLAASKARWATANRYLRAAAESRRRAVLRRGQPPWIKCYEKQMKEFAKECHRLGLTADHIVPLQGKTVSGLHVPWNMQMLTKSDNCKKRNTFCE